MKIPLTHFEEVIVPKILERGLAYFEDGAVEIPEHISEDTYSADVVGTDVYSITYRMSGEVMTDFSCTCPYDGGPVCKHVAALLFYLRAEDLFDDKDIPASGRKRGKKEHNTPGAVPKRRGRPPGSAKSKATGDGTSRDQASVTKGSPKKRSAKKSTPDEVLGQVSMEQLKDFMREEVLQDKALKAKFMLRFTADTGTATVKSYVTQVKDLLRGIPMRTGYQAWRAGPKVWSAIQPMLQLLDERVDQGRNHDAMCMSFALLEVSTGLIEKVDDSYGHVGDVIQRAFKQLRALANRELDDPLRTEFLTTSLEYYRKKRFEGWDWHEDMLSLAVPLCRTPQEAGPVMEILDRQSRAEGYAGVEAVRLRYELIGRIEGEQKAEAFLKSNLKIPEMRTIAIDRAFKKEDYTLARKLVMDGMAASEKDKYRHLLAAWHDWLLRIALNTEDTMTIREQARILLFGGIRRMEMLGILKRHTDADDWPAVVKSIISEIFKKGSELNASLYLDIILFTDDEERLMAFLLDSHMCRILTSDGLHNFAVRLYGKWPDKVLDAYEGLILREFEHSHTTNAYERSAQVLRKMKKLGNLDRVAGLIGQLRKKYPRRPALLAALDKI